MRDQYYDICIRRARGYCSICYSPHIVSSTMASSYGIGASSDDATQKSTIGSQCTGVTTLSSIETNQVGLGDYLEIPGLQNTPVTNAEVSRICGSFWNAIKDTATHATLCSIATPFRVGVHFDADEAIYSPLSNDKHSNSENQFLAASTGAGLGYNGFYLNYWQATC